MSACEHGWASENYVKCPRCYDNARHAEGVARLTAALAESEARRAEAEGRVAGHLAARLAMREEADRSRAERDDMSAERDAALRRAGAAESSLAVARDVLRQVDAKRHGSCWWCGRMPGEEHGNGCDLARALGGGRG